MICLFANLPSFLSMRMQSRFYLKTHLNNFSRIFKSSFIWNLSIWFSIEFVYNFKYLYKLVRYTAMNAIRGQTHDVKILSITPRCQEISPLWWHATAAASKWFAMQKLVSFIRCPFQIYFFNTITMFSAYEVVRRWDLINFNYQCGMSKWKRKMSSWGDWLKCSDVISEMQTSKNNFFDVSIKKIDS